MAASNDTNSSDKEMSHLTETNYVNSLERNDPFEAEGSGTAKFLGSIGKNDFHTMKIANSSTSKRSTRAELTKSELLKMLAYLEGELQARDVIIAALRNERVKTAIHIIRSNPIKSNDPYAALLRDKIFISGGIISRQSSITAIQAESESRTLLEQQMEALCQVTGNQRLTHSRIIKMLRESLENNQRMRLELEEEKRKHEHDTAQGDDITYGLEMERTKLKQELESEKNLRKKLEKDSKKLQEQLDNEKEREKQMVLLLLAERKKIIMKYIEERKRSEDLAQILSEEKQRSDTIADGLEEESKKSLRMEAELEKQALSIDNERKIMKLNIAKEEKRIKELELEITQLRNENESFRKQGISIRMQTTSGPSLSAKTRSISDDIVLTAPSSVMNVAKIVQPTATVSSVPVSGPTTGIARSLSPGQGLRPQSVPYDTSMMSAAALNSSATKVTPRTLSNSTCIVGSSVQPQSQEFQSTLSSTTTQSVLSSGSTSSNSFSSVTPSITGKNLTSQISNPIARLGTAQNVTSVTTSSSVCGRGVPPPIPPNKPIVPPKREPSTSRLGMITSSNTNIIQNSVISNHMSSTPAVSSNSSS